MPPKRAREPSSMELREILIELAVQKAESFKTGRCMPDDEVKTMNALREFYHTLCES